MNKKALIIGGGAVALVAIIVALIFIFTGGEDAYRSIKVFEIDGSCTVDRDGDTLDAFKNMSLSSGDSFTVGEGSFARLKLDDDKYVYLEANTKINLTATGTANDSKTMVYIERGSMLTEVKKKLSATSSYDIVTPNTTMSIRGTKTLTEVYEDVLGAIKTNAAVVEGQVSFKTIQKDSTGKAVIVTTDLSVGQGLGVTTDSKDLLSQEDVKHIADDGKTVDGQTAEETTHEELGTTLETPVFSEDFLTNIVAVLARSREEDIEEGFAAEDVTEEELNAAINILNDVIDGKVEIPAAVEEYVISQAQPYYDEPIVYDTPVTGGNNDTTTQPPVESEPELNTDDTVIPEDQEGAGDDTFVVDGTGETLVGIGDDADDNDAAVTDEESDDESDAADDEADDETADESDEDDKSDEGDDAAEDGDEEVTDDESDEDGEDKEDAEETEDEDKEEESEGTEDESEEQQEETAVQQPGTSETDPNTQGGGGTGTGTSGTSTPEPVVVTIGSTSRDFSTGNGSGQSSSTQTVTLKFINTSNSQTMSAESVSSGLSAGDPLPGLSDIGPYTIELMIGDVVTHDYEFTGWYSSQEAAQNYDSNYLITEVPSAPLSIFPGIRAVEATYTVTIINTYPEAGTLVYPSNSSDGLTYAYNSSNNAVTISGFTAGTMLTLPEVQRLAERRDSSGYTDKPYIARNNSNEVYTDFYCFSNSDSLDVAKRILKQQSPTGTDSDGTWAIYNPILFGSAPAALPEVNELEITGNITVYMYFVSQIEVRTACMEDHNTLLIYASSKDPSGTDFTDQDLSNQNVRAIKQTAQYVYVPNNEQNTDYQTWQVQDYNGHASFATLYWGKPLRTPQFTCSTSGQVSGATYNGDVLRNYKASLSSPTVTPYDGPLYFAPSGSANSFPFTEGQRSGKFTLTEQAVDWVYLDMSVGSEFTSISHVGGGSVFPIGNNNPFVIKSSDYGQNGKYRLAVDPVNLYETTDQTAPFDIVVNTGNVTDILKIYLPDDVVYPWSKGGELRAPQNGTDPASLYLSDVIGDTNRLSYAYVGCNNMRLIGFNSIAYAMDGSQLSPIGNSYILHDSGNDEYTFPVLKTGTDVSVTNLISLSTLLGNSVDSSLFLSLETPLTISPMFDRVYSPVARLVYTETVNSSIGSYDAKGLDEMLGHYSISIEGIPSTWFTGNSSHKLKLDDLHLDYVAYSGSQISSTNFTAESFISEVYYGYNQNTSGNTYLTSNSNNVIPPQGGTDPTVTHDGTALNIPLSLLWIDNGGSNKINTVGFARGLYASGSSTGFAEYKPKTYMKITTETSERYKYSCFLSNKGIGRVFTSNQGDTFSVAQTSEFGDASFAGMMMDLYGATYPTSQINQKGFYDVFYGGEITPYANRATGEVFVHNTAGNAIAQNALESFKKSVHEGDTVTSSSIVSYLGIGSQYAGIFSFKPYRYVTDKNGTMDAHYMQQVIDNPMMPGEAVDPSILNYTSGSYLELELNERYFKRQSGYVIADFGSGHSYMVPVSCVEFKTSQPV